MTQDFPLIKNKLLARDLLAPKRTPLEIEMVKVFKALRKTIHDAHHDGLFPTCTKDFCMTIRKIVFKAEAKQ